MSGVDMPLMAVRSSVASAIQLVITCERLFDGSRKVTSISQVLPLDERGEYRTLDLFVYAPLAKTADGRVVGLKLKVVGLWTVKGLESYEWGACFTTLGAVQRLLDKDEIVDLVHRYSYLVDHKVYDEIAELFTEDCVVDYGIAPPLHGRDALRAMFGRGEGFVATSHHNANVLVTFEDDDRAVVLTSLYAWHLTSTDSTPRVWGYYHDVAVRTADGWRLAERVLRVAGNQDWDVSWHPLI